jgi:hypothetical protein
VPTTSAFPTHGVATKMTTVMMAQMRKTVLRKRKLEPELKAMFVRKDNLLVSLENASIKARFAIGSMVSFLDFLEC